MAFFIATMTHPDGEGWNTHLVAHMEYLKSMLRTGKLRASGPVLGYGLRAGFLIFQADTQEEVARLIGQDPFSLNDLVVSLTIHAWDPVMGQYHDESSRSLPAWGEAANDTWRLPAPSRGSYDASNTEISDAS